MARAMWKGNLQVGKQELAVKLYSAIEDRTVRFHLLHEKDRAPVEQHIVRKDTGEDVKREDMRKAFALSGSTAVILEPEDLEKLVPPESRDIEICRFVAPSVLGDQWFDRPYYLGPDADDSDYFALAEALHRKNVIGIARWVMRKKRYVGALTATDGYLMLSAWTNEYRERLHKLIEAKARGEKIERVQPKKKAPSASLADSLRASIAAVKEKKVA
jgi:DNA end-binding protein Ku